MYFRKYEIPTVQNPNSCHSTVHSERKSKEHEQDKTKIEHTGESDDVKTRRRSKLIVTEKSLESQKDKTIEIWSARHNIRARLSSNSFFNLYG